LPILQPNRSVSSAYIPTKEEHDCCERVLTDFPNLPTLEPRVLDTPNTAWHAVKPTPIKGNSLMYSSEADLVHIVRMFVESVVRGLGLTLELSGELSIQHVRPDLSVILNDNYLVGVIEVKKPTDGVLEKPTVLGELFDQLVLVEGFYGMGPAIGILTTGEEWIFSWFPADHDTLSNRNAERVDLFTTPTKQKGSNSESKTHSPPGNTPSHKSGYVHHIDSEEDESTVEVDPPLSSPVERLLCTTPVMNIHSDPIDVLNHLCGALLLMSTSQLHDRGLISRCLLRFHKDTTMVSYHSATYDQVFSTVNFDRFPNRNTKNLIALEDLGRGATGKAWLCVTMSTPNSSACVLKFHNNKKKNDLEKEKDFWHLIYPEFSKMVRIEHWSGEDALVMPHFTEVLESNRHLYRDALFDTLTSKFMNNGLYHGDVKWKNIGIYLKNGVEILVVFDLHSVESRVVDRAEWFENVAKSLF
jgi:hypothetical protein